MGETKRQNFNITPEQEAEIEQVRQALAAPSTKDALLRAVRILTVLHRETGRGHALYTEAADGTRTRLLIPELEPAAGGGAPWMFLVERPHPWRRQLYVKGRRLPAARVWADMAANGQTPAQAAEEWGLPVEAVREIVRYCEENRALLEMEAQEERRRLEGAGVTLTPEAGAGARAAV